MIAIASPDSPTRYHLMRALWQLGVRSCGVSSTEGLEYIVREGLHAPHCAIVDEALCDEGGGGSRRLRRALGGIPLVGLGQAPDSEHREDPARFSHFDYRLAAPAGARQLGDLVCWLRGTSLYRMADSGMGQSK